MPEEGANLVDAEVLEVPLEILPVRHRHASALCEPVSLVRRLFDGQVRLAVGGELLEEDLLRDLPGDRTDRRCSPSERCRSSVTVPATVEEDSVLRVLLFLARTARTGALIIARHVHVRFAFLAPLRTPLRLSVRAHILQPPLGSFDCLRNRRRHTLRLPRRATAWCAWSVGH